MSLRYAYWPGCVAKSMCLELDMAAKATCAALGIELKEMEDATCTGARDLHQTPHGELKLHTDQPDLEILLNARTFSIAEGWGMNIMTVCNTCTVAMRSVNIRLKENKELLANTNALLRQSTGRSYNGTIEIRHFMNVITEDIGLERLSSKLKKPLRGLKLAPFVGCHSIRPPKYAFDDPYHPHLLEDIIRACGAEPVDYDYKLACCGFHVKLAEGEVATITAGDTISSAKKAGAQGMVSPCPLCHMAFDLWQSDAEKLRKEKLDMPQLHSPQVVGLALGIDPKELGIDRHIVNARGLAPA